MSEKTRANLKNAFRKGKIPLEEDFYSLIDSGLNKADDGITKTKGEGIRLQSDGPNNELFAFYKNIRDLNPDWYINQKTEDGNTGFNIGEPNGGSRFFIEHGGNVGIGITKPNHKLDVDGIVGMKGRVGYYAFGEVPADGKWHDILPDLNEYQAFEVVATAGTKGAHAIMHAIAVCTYGKSRGGISQTNGYFGRSRNKLELRWTGSYFSYQLQLRSRRHYGEGVLIRYNISKLF
ncbi:MAG: hypothetical protein FD123_4107 [Bacteroidetes bacterium]|nr:MAG: hypothetical protein FD123_4107 [Bacteroidota bacterium]